MKKSVKMEEELEKKKWPVWVKILGIISILIIIFLIGLIIWATFRTDERGLLTAIFSFWYISVIVGMWVLGFLTKYLIKKELYWIANIISIIGLIVFSVGFSLLLIVAITQPHMFNRLRTLANIGGFILFSGWTLIPIIYFIISLILINKVRKQNK